MSCHVLILASMLRILANASTYTIPYHETFAMPQNNVFRKGMRAGVHLSSDLISQSTDLERSFQGEKVCYPEEGGEEAAEEGHEHTGPDSRHSNHDCLGNGPGALDREADLKQFKVGTSTH